MTLMTDLALAEKKLGASAVLLNVTLLFRRIRRREFEFTSKGGEFLESQLLELRFGLGEIERSYDERHRATIDILDRISKVLQRHLPEFGKPSDLIELGEIRDALLDLNRARGITPPPIPPEAMTGPVYVPEEYRPTEYLGDMVAPTGGAPRAIHSALPATGNVVPFGRRGSTL